MRISIRVKPNAQASEVEEIGKDQFLVRVKSPPKGNKANQEVIEILASYFDVPKSKVSILRGLTSRHKIVHIHKDER